MVLWHRNREGRLVDRYDETRLIEYVNSTVDASEPFRSEVEVDRVAGSEQRHSFVDEHLENSMVIGDHHFHHLDRCGTGEQSYASHDRRDRYDEPDGRSPMHEAIS